MILWSIVHWKVVSLNLWCADFYRLLISLSHKDVGRVRLACVIYGFWYMISTTQIYFPCILLHLQVLPFLGQCQFIAFGYIQWTVLLLTLLLQDLTEWNYLYLEGGNICTHDLKPLWICLETIFWNFSKCMIMKSLW